MNRAELGQLINNKLPTNDDQLITAADVRSVLTSLLNELPLRNSEGVVLEYNEAAVYAAGSVVALADGLYKSITQTTGEFNPSHWTRLLPLVVENGIASLEVNEAGNLIGNLTNGGFVQVGRVKGEDGVSVTNIVHDEPTGRIIFYTSNGAVFPTGDLRGANGLDGVRRFTELLDAPNTLAGQAGKIIGVNLSGDALEFIDLPSAANSFLGLTDTPNSFLGFEEYALRVKSDGTGLEFVEVDAIVNSFTALSDAPPSYTGQGGKVVGIKSDESGLEFVDLALVSSDNLSAQNPKWGSGFFDRIGFNLVNSGTGSSIALTQIGNTTDYSPAQGVIELKSGTTGTGSAQIRRDGSNGTTYQYYSSGAKFKFDFRISVSQLPTAEQPFLVLFSFHNSTGPASNGRAAISLSFSSDLGRAAFSLSTSTGSLTTSTSSLVIPSINTWYKITLEIDRDNNSVKMFINNILDSIITTNMPIAGYYGMYIGIVNSGITMATSPVLAIDHYLESIEINSPVIW